MQKRQRWVIAIVLASFMGLGGYTLFRVGINDRLNTMAKLGNIASMQSLLKQGANVEGRSIHFETPLMSAAEGGNKNSVLFLLSHGADVNAHNDSGSVLMWAAASGNAGIVRVLIAHGVDVNWRSNRGDTALQTSKEYKQPVITRILQLAGAKS